LPSSDHSSASNSVRLSINQGHGWTKQCGYGPVVNPAEMHLSEGTVKLLLV